MQLRREIAEVRSAQRDLTSIASHCRNVRDGAVPCGRMDCFEVGNAEGCSRPQRRLHEIATLHRRLPASLGFAPVETRGELKASAGMGVRRGISLAKAPRTP